MLAFFVLASATVDLRGQEIPATQPMSTRDSFLQEINALGMALSEVIPADELAFKDPVKRAEVGRLVIPIVKKALAAIDRAPLSCNGGNMSPMKTDWEPLLIVFGDADFTRLAREQAAGNDEAAFNARLTLAIANATLALDDRDKTETCVKQVIELARQKPESERATIALIRFKDDERLKAESKESVQSALDQATSLTATSLRRFLTTKPSS